ncbi:MAG: Uma2 family endonuclease [Anaerolineae bacterium]|nr:Uma2 family endonuclease [Anaerolineae bacterium]
MAIHEKTTYTIAEYQRLMEQSENTDRIVELIDGELVEKMPSFTPSKIAAEIIFAIKLFLRENPIGYVTTEGGGYIMPNGDILIPDVGYVAKVHLPELPEREAPVPPDFAVEVKSPTDRKRALRNKVERYLQHGTQLVWLVFPDERIVEVYVAGEDADVQTVTIDGILDGGSVLPGFTLKVSDIFA